MAEGISSSTFAHQDFHENGFMLPTQLNARNCVKIFKKTVVGYINQKKSYKNRYIGKYRIIVTFITIDI